MQLIDKTIVTLKKFGEGLVVVAGECAGLFQNEDDEKEGPRPKIVVVRETGGGGELRRKRSIEDLREVSRRTSRDAKSFMPEDLPQSGQGDKYTAAGDGRDPAYLLEHDPGPAQPRQAIQRNANRSRPGGLVIDSDVIVGTEDIDTPVSPTNVSRPFGIPPETPANRAGVSETYDADRLMRRTFLIDQRRFTTASAQTYIDPQERFDSYIDTLDDEAAKRCSLHAILSTDIARLVAELDVLHNRIAMANMRAAYHRRATLNAFEARPESWKPVSHTCTCGRRVEVRSEEKRAKRETWHAGSQAPVREGSPASETKEDVMVRHSAGTNLFRMSMHEGQTKRRARSLSFESAGGEGVGVQQRAPQVELNRSFEFRRECERVARRIRPTFSVRRA